MSVKSFSASEVVTSAEMTKATIQLPNTVIYGALSNGIERETLETDPDNPEVMSELEINALLGRYLFVAFEKHTNSGTLAFIWEARFYLPDGSRAFVVGSQLTGSTLVTAYTESTYVLDLLEDPDGDGVIDLRGARVRLEFVGHMPDGGQGWMKNLVLMGGSSPNVADYGY